MLKLLTTASLALVLVIPTVGYSAGQSKFVTPTSPLVKSTGEYLLGAQEEIKTLHDMLAAGDTLWSDLGKVYHETNDYQTVMGMAEAIVQSYRDIRNMALQQIKTLNGVRDRIHHIIYKDRNISRMKVTTEKLLASYTELSDLASGWLLERRNLTTSLNKLIKSSESEEKIDD